MAYLLSFGLLVLLAAFLIGKVAAAARGTAPKKPVAKTPERARKEQELLERLQRIRKKKEQAVADAVHDDPKRAAKVVSRMMRDKGTAKNLHFLELDAVKDRKDTL